MSDVQDIVSDAEIERVHGSANFGSMDKRDVVNEGVLKYAFGYSTGHTQMCILREHGLVQSNKSGKRTSPLTQKGFRYLRAMIAPVTTGGILRFIQDIRP